MKQTISLIEYYKISGRLSDQTKELNIAKNEITMLEGENADLRKVVTRLREENALMQEALTIFADPSNWERQDDGDVVWYEWCGDFGAMEIAQHALRKEVK